ncbi:MAG: putative dual-specificity RNA methyltransferase RlmN [Thermomicrobiales bacterium]|nr:MAG: putative dual-specificity RNA methyltransferase RlmN [Thermomicrobiales bacterium]
MRACLPSPNAGRGAGGEGVPPLSQDWRGTRWVGSGVRAGSAPTSHGKLCVMESVVSLPRVTKDTEHASRPARIAVPRRDRPVSLYDLTLPELTERLVALGQPAYRARQIFAWVYKQLVSDYAAMTNLPRPLRQDLETLLPIATMTPVRAVTSDDGETIKTLYRTHDGQFVEAVLMLYPDRATVCVSCQVGCAVGCAFCATGLEGLKRNLTAGEMVQQAVDAAREARRRGRSLTNLVMMGMGEPFHNYEATMKMVAILHEPHGFNFGARRMTISTSGVVPFIDRLADEPYQINLAVSLHAPNDELRSRLVPINRRYPIADLLAACRRYIEKTGRRVSFEYALMKGINDADEIALELGKLLRGMLCHVNLIPLNPVDVLPYERPDPEGIERFASIVRAAGVPTTVRYSRGVDIAAACGQLRAQHQQALSTLT